MLLRTDILTKNASNEGYGILCCRPYDVNSIKHCFDAATIMKAPLIINCCIDDFDIKEITGRTKYYAYENPFVPVSLVIQGIKTYEDASKGIISGCSCISIDSSLKDPKEIDDIYRLSKAMNISVERSLLIDYIKDLDSIINTTERIRTDILKLIFNFTGESNEIDGLCQAIRMIKEKATFTIAINDVSKISEVELKKLNRAGVSKFDFMGNASEEVYKAAVSVIKNLKMPRLFLFETDNEMKKAYINSITAGMRSLSSYSRW